MIVCGLFVFLCVLVSPSFGLPFEDAAAILTSPQSNHYTQVKATLDQINKLADELYYVEYDLKHNAEIYLQTLSSDALNNLDDLRAACEFREPCLACFGAVPQIPNVAQTTSDSLLQYIESQINQISKSIQEITINIGDSALLSNEVYEKYGSDPNLEANAETYYAKIQKALKSEVALFEKVVNQTKSALIERYILDSVKASDKINELYETITACAEDALELK